MLEASCDKSDESTCHAIGRRPASERAKIDAALAATNKECESGNGPSCMMLSRFYFNDVRYGDQPAGRRYAEKACALKEQNGCMYLGQAAATGIGGATDLGLAARTLVPLCEAGNKQACSLLDQVKTAIDTKR